MISGEVLDILLGDIRRMRFPPKLDKTRRLGETPDAAEKRIQAVQMPGEGHGRLFGHGLLILLKAPTRLGRPNSQLEQKTRTF